MARPMQFHPVLRTAFWQGLAMVGFGVFLSLLHWEGSAVQARAGSSKPHPAAAAFVGAARQQEPPPPEDRNNRPENAERKAEEKPRQPERFRPSSQENERAETVPEQPPAAGGRPRDVEQVSVPPRDLPLSYLMKFKGMQDFHSFLDDVQDRIDPDARTMSLVRIEGLPDSVDELQRLFESYRMDPFLYNPDRFNYLVTGELELLRNRQAIQDYISRVGRFIREDESNPAYRAIKRRFVDRARQNSGIRKALGGDAEFGNMELGLASRQLTAFLHRLEKDTVRQVSELLGRSLSVEDMARIDCRFENVRGAVVLVPWRAYVATGDRRRPVDIWKQE